VDIDTFEDLSVCEGILTRKRIVFAVTGYPAVGLGHAFRAVMLANELVKHELRFVCEARSALAAETIRERNYSVDVCPDGGLLEAVLAQGPDLVINDILDTDAAYVRALKSAGCRVVNFEDLGAGGDHADLVINALYDDRPERRSHLAGPDYFCLRDEFLYLPERKPRPAVERVLVTFGGTDENNLTARIVGLLAPECRRRGIAIDVVVGPGYGHRRELDEAVRQCGEGVRVASGTSRISDYMLTADLALTSGGRTVLELASLRIPTLVICQNERELTHRFASPANGVQNLGLHRDAAPGTIVESFVRLVEDRDLREAMRERMNRWDLTRGKRRVVSALASVLD
jgi:spore coat polysaccharide biosynthesis predicted glycosyltransferase SpsG